MKEYAVGDYVNYKQNGVCRIKGKVIQNFAFMGEGEYYELSPIYEERTVIYVPLKSDRINEDMFPVLTPDEAEAEIKRSLECDMEWKADQRERAKDFNDILLSRDRAMIIMMLRKLLEHRKSIEENNRKMYASDLRALTAAQKCITEEFSFVLGMEKETIISYISGE